jgi:2-polyprenyl-3-methyl-5-hydroxy-6-metoxy-1,4-benzoquinol methylase
MDYLTFLTRVIYRREFGRISDFAKQKLAGKKSAVGASATYDAIARLLAGSIAGEPVVVDYGCGLGYISFEIGMMRRLSKTYLVDIDCLTLEFAEFRFKKHGLNVETIPISKNRIYPELPTHNICIATEVMEHVFQPLTVYANIYGALEPGGILYGDFGDHHHEMFHVSPDLSQLRVSIQRDFQRLDDLCYRKLG